MQVFEEYEDITTLVEVGERLEYLRERICPSCGTKGRYMVVYRGKISIVVLVSMKVTPRTIITEKTMLPKSLRRRAIPKSTLVRCLMGMKRSDILGPA